MTQKRRNIGLTAAALAASAIFLTLLAVSVKPGGVSLGFAANESGYTLRLVTPVMGSSKTNESYNVSLVVGTSFSALSGNESGYQIKGNIHTSGVGGAYNESGYSLYLTPEGAFHSYRSGITAHDPGTANTTTTTLPPDGSSCSMAMQLPEYNQSTSTQLFYSYNTSDTCNVTVRLDSAAGADYDLYVLWNGSCPSTNIWHCRPYTGETPELCGNASLPAGQYYALVKRYYGTGTFNITIQSSDCGVTTTSTTSTTTSSTTSSTTTSTIAETTTTVPAESWPTFHHDAARTGATANIGPLTNATMWTYTTGGSVVSSPAVANNVVYVGSYDKKVYAINVANGTQIWNYSTNGTVESSPTVYEGVVYVGSWDKRVYALNASTGAHMWNYSTGNNTRFSPAVANGVVYAGSNDGKVYALNATNGTQIWNYTTDGTIQSSPAVANGIVYAGSSDGVFYAINATTGVQLWNYSNGTDSLTYPTSSAAIANGIVYVGKMDNKIYAFNASTGALIWSYATGDDVHSTPAVSGGIVYAGSRSYDKKIYALNATNGARIWNYTTGNDVYSSPAVANGVVYVGSNDGLVYALNATNGARIWNYTTGGLIQSSSPAIANGVAYVGASDRKVYAIGSYTNATTTTITTTTTTTSTSTTTTSTISITTTLPAVVINEFLPHPSQNTQEWIELYNTENNTVNISGLKLDDTILGGSEPYTIPNSTTIAARNFTVFYANETGIVLGDLGDTIRLYDSESHTLDNFTYYYSQRGISIGRETDGGSEWTTFELPTPGRTNAGVNDTNPPSITLNSPPHEAVDLDGNIFFTYTPYDQSLLSNCVLYTDVTGTWAITQIDSTVLANSRNSFGLFNLADGTYLWNVQCTDETALSASAPRSMAFTVNRTANTTFNRQLNLTLNTTTNVTSNETNVTLGIVMTENVTNAYISIASQTNNTRNVSLTVQGLNKFITVEASTELEESVSNYTLTIYYTPEEVAAAGLNETDLGIYWYNETLESWQLLDNDTMDWVRATGVNTSSHYVWAVVTHFSDYTIAQTTQTQEVPLQQGWNLISLPLV